MLLWLRLLKKQYQVPFRSTGKGLRVTKILLGKVASARNLGSMANRYWPPLLRARVQSLSLSAISKRRYWPRGRLNSIEKGDQQHCFCS